MTDFLPWTVRHVSLDETLPDLAADAGSGGLFVVFWCAGIPLGQWLLPAAMLPLDSAHLATTVPAVIAEALAHRLLGHGFDAAESAPGRSGESPDLARVVALRRPLQSLARLAHAAPGDTADPSVSIVICTKNRPDSLHRCLQSIHALSPAASEVVVVDNDPASGVTQTVAARFPQVRYLPEPRPGLSIARNRGLRSCVGTIIAFTDDDVVVHPGWIAAVRAAFHDRKVIAMTGLVLPAALETPAQRVFQNDALDWHWRYQEADFDDRFFAATRHLGVPAWQVGAGSNMAFRRDAFDRVGLFDERLGAGAAGCSEDSELRYRLLAQGDRCRYSPSAVVFHHHRSDWDGLQEQLRSSMRGHVAALLFQFERHGHWGNVYRAFVALPWHLVTLAVRASKQRLQGWIYEPGTAPLLAPVVPQILGAVAGYGYFLRHRVGSHRDAIARSVARTTEAP